MVEKKVKKTVDADVTKAEAKTEAKVEKPAEKEKAEVVKEVVADAAEGRTIKEEKAETPVEKVAPAKPVTLPIPVPKDKDTMAKLLGSGMHFGHRSSKWNPKMKPFIYAERNGIHILDLTKSIDALNAACEFLMRAAAIGDVLFVGTKKQSQEIVENEAKRCGAYYVVRRWPGGQLTNFKIMRNSIDKLDAIVASFEQGIENRTKYELVQLKRELKKLNMLYGGVRGMKRYPQAIVVVDAKVERIAILEAKRMGIPVVAMLDTNSDPTIVKYPIPGNDDATKAISVVISTLATAVLKGNKGNGVKHMPIDFAMIDDRIEKMTEALQKKKEELQPVKKEDKTKMLKVSGRNVKIIRKKQ